MKTVFIAMACLVAGASATLAQSSLGLNIAEVSLGGIAVDQEAGQTQVHSVQGSADFTITEHHGVQFDLAYTGYEIGDLGHLGGHLYMVPQEGRKYGLFFSYADFNEFDSTNTVFGFEGMFEVNERVTLEGRFGLGIATDSLDYIFAAGSVDLAVSDRLSLGTSLSLTDIEELSLSGLAYDARVSADYRVSSRIGLSAHIGALGIEGASRIDATPQAGLTLSYRFGGFPKTDAPVRERLFERHNPLHAVSALSAY